MVDGTERSSPIKIFHKEDDKFEIEVKLKLSLKEISNYNTFLLIDGIK